jgi:hypothetical protein
MRVYRSNPDMGTAWFNFLSEASFVDRSPCAGAWLSVFTTPPHVAAATAAASSARARLQSPARGAGQSAAADTNTTAGFSPGRPLQHLTPSREAKRVTNGTGADSAAVNFASPVTGAGNYASSGAGGALSAVKPSAGGASHPPLPKVAPPPVPADSGAGSDWLVFPFLGLA